jgi:hypothetical protein
MWDHVRSPLSKTFSVYVSTGGGDAFHALVLGQARDRRHPVQYLMFSDNEWSAPIEVGLADTGRYWSHISGAFGLTGTRAGGAFIAWPMKHGIVGRWVERVK